MPALRRTMFVENGMNKEKMRRSVYFMQAKKEAKQKNIQFWACVPGEVNARGKRRVTILVTSATAMWLSNRFSVQPSELSNVSDM